MVKSCEMCLCLSEGETVKLVLSVRFNWSGTVKYLLLTDLSPFFFFTFYHSSALLTTLVSCSLSTQETCISFSSTLLPLCLTFSLFSCIPCCCLCVSWEFCCCVCLFFFVHISFVVPHLCISAADVHIIPYNTLVINHVSLFHQPRYRHTVFDPTSGPLMAERWYQILE